MPPIVPKKIKIKKDEGPVTIEVTSGFASLGSYALGLIKMGDSNLTEFGKDPKRIDDNVPDMHLIPLDPTFLNIYFVSIIGKYAPAPLKTQISVSYHFIQNLNVVHIETIQENLPDDQQFIRTNHLYTFDVGV